MDKYEALFQWSNEVLAKEHSRYHSADEKAAKYLAALMFFAGAYAFFAQWMVAALDLIPPRSGLDWALALIAGVELVAIVAAWFMTFSVLRVHPLRERPLNDEVIRFFDSNSMIDIHFALARANAAALAENRQRTDRKYDRLNTSYLLMKCIVWLLLALAAMYTVHQWIGLPGSTRAGQL